MKIEMGLKKLLRDYNLYEYGVEQRMARECNVHRHTIGKLMGNKMKNPSLEVLGRVSQWLVENNIPAEILPGALFVCRAPALWKAIRSAPSVGIYLGMYESTMYPISSEGMRASPMSIALNDAAVESRIIRLLSTKGENGDARPIVKTRYVPFSFNPLAVEASGPLFEEDKKGAMRIFKEMEGRYPHENAILLGSQRVNYVIECFVANHFNCMPFKPVKKQPEVPFHLSYRDFDRPVPSCFGGTQGPPGYNGSVKPGIYYIAENNEWNLFEWKENEWDAGVVMIIRDAHTIVMGAFGLSGRATHAVGSELIGNAEKFWPEIPEKRRSGKKGKDKGEQGKTEPETIANLNGKEVGVYICRVKLSGKKAEQSTWVPDDYKDDKVDVLPLRKDVIERYAKKSGSSSFSPSETG